MKRNLFIYYNTPPHPRKQNLWGGGRVILESLCLCVHLFIHRHNLLNTNEQIWLKLVYILLYMNNEVIYLLFWLIFFSHSRKLWIFFQLCGLASYCNDMFSHCKRRGYNRIVVSICLSVDVTLSGFVLRG